jgi:ribonucleoside-triphosphate reductase
MVSVINFHEQQPMVVKSDHPVEKFEDVLKQVPARSLKLLGLEDIDPMKILERYDAEDLLDMTTDANANIGGKKSIQNRIAEAIKPALRMKGYKDLYTKGRELFGDEFDMAPLFKGQLYFHNSTKMERPYCIGVSAMDIMMFGRPYAQLYGVVPKHIDSFVGQCVEYLMNLSLEFAGATAMTDFIPCLAWYAEKEDIPIKSKDHRMISVVQQWQHFVHIVHNNYRHDGDPPFTNISINSESVMKQVFEHYVFPDGKKIQDIMPTVMKVQEAIAQVMHDGDPKKGGLQYKFPIITCNFKPKDVGSKWWEQITALNNKGCFNISIAEQFSSCCRLLSDVDEMLKYKTYSNGTGGLKVGAHRVIAMNLPGLAHDYKDDYEDGLDMALDASERYLFTHKVGMLLPWVKRNMYTFFSKFIDGLGEDTGIGPWLHLNMLFSTNGINGVPDAVDLLVDNGEKYNILRDEGFEVAKRMLKHISDGARKRSGRLEKEGIKCFFNVEQTPAESSSATMAQFYGDKMYSNQFVPLEADCDIWERVRIEGELSSMITGGSMTFLTLEKLMTPEQSVKFHNRVMEASHMKLNQFCVNYGWSVDCNHSFVGNFQICPSCGKKMVPHERVVGYMVKKGDINHARVENDIERRHRNLL